MTKNNAASATFEREVRAFMASQDARFDVVEQALLAFIEAPANKPEAAPAKGKGKGKAKAESTGVSFQALRQRLREHKAAGAIKAGVTVREAIAAGLITETGDLPGEVPVVAEAPAKKGKKGKKGKKAGREQIVARVVADEPAYMSDEWIAQTHPREKDTPRNAKGQPTPKAEWKIRHVLAESGKFSRDEIDTKVRELMPVIAD